MANDKPINAMYGQKVKLDLDKLKNRSKDEPVVETVVDEPVEKEVVEQHMELKRLAEQTRTQGKESYDQEEITSDDRI